MMAKLKELQRYAVSELEEAEGTERHYILGYIQAINEVVTILDESN